MSKASPVLKGDWAVLGGPVLECCDLGWVLSFLLGEVGIRIETSQLIDSGVWGEGGVNTEFNLPSHNTCTCPENVDSFTGRIEAKKQGPNGALMYRRE